ncbi:MAG: ChaN family lipoprotein [Nitrosomonadales bacterium]|nr:ChaN family lipoprotein [Nitrosomonadales bacterium]
MITASFKFGLTFALLLVTGLAHAGNMLFADHPLAGKIWDMNSRSFIDEAALLARTNKADVLLLGETHDNTLHHEYQLKLLKARIDAVKYPALMPALMMEQLNAEDQQALDWTLTGVNRDETLERVTRLIRFADIQAYQPFLATAIDNKLPVIAANISNLHSQPVVRGGFTAYDAGELKRLAVEEVWNDSRQKFLIENMGGAHCGKLRDDLREGLTRGQRLRDALMADVAVPSIARGVVGIVGSSHARRDIGLPLYFAARAPTARILSVGFIEVSPGVTGPHAYEKSSATGEAPYDVIWFTPRVERTDPCANLDKSKVTRQ